MCKSPIEVITEQINMQIENEVYKAVGNVGIDVDREELLKALAYDRGQYEQGYRDALKERLEIVRCKDCKHRDPEDHKCDCGHDIQWQLPRGDDWFCADGKRRRSRMDDNENMCKVITSGYCPYAYGVDEDVKSCADCPWHNPEAERKFFE